MRRGLIVGAAILVAAVAAVPLWLIIDDGGVRRLGAIDPATVHGAAGRMTIAGMNAGAPFPIDSFSLNFERSLGATQPETDSIAVTLDVGTAMPQLLGRAVQGTKAATAKVELVESIGGVLTAYMTFDLTGVSIETFGDSWTQLTGSSLRATEQITLRYDGMTVSCIPSVCAQPTHAPGTATEVAMPDLGAKGVRIDASTFSVPKDFKGATAFPPATVTMGPNYLVPLLLNRAREAKPFEKTTIVEMVEYTDTSARKRATYKLAAAAVTSIGIGAGGGEMTVVVGLSFRRMGATAYEYLASGALDKSTSFCWDVVKVSNSCTGL